MNLYHKLVGYKSRANYWSCSAVANYLLKEMCGVEKPGALSMEEWRDWRNVAEGNNPKAYWLIEEGFNHAQDAVLFIPDVYHNISNYINNAYVHKSHVMITGLEKGQWHDCDSRIVEGLFCEVVRFVEDEKSHMMEYCGGDDYDPNDDKRTAGLKYLDWEITLTGNSVQQAEAAKEIKDIYIWITDVYPNRPDAHDVSGWSEHCEGRDIFDPTETEEDKENVRRMLDECHTIEEIYHDEETEMLNRIIKIRAAMWT